MPRATSLTATAPIPATWPAIYSKGVAAGFHQEVMNAEINAHDTVHVDKAAPIECFNRIALDTLAEHLASSDATEAARKFFVALGIRF